MKKIIVIAVLVLAGLVYFACKSTDTGGDELEGQDIEKVDTTAEADIDAMEDQLEDLDEETGDTAFVEEEDVSEEAE